MVNVVGTINVLLAARNAGVRRIIFSGSSSGYGDQARLPLQETMSPNPLSPYALQKLAGEEYTRLFHRLYGMETLTLRYFNVFGPRQDPGSQYSGVISRFVDSLIRDERPVIFGDGEQSRDFTYIDNVVQANLRAAETEKGIGQVPAVGDDFGGQFVERQGRLHDPRPHGERLGDSKPSPVRHGTEEVIDVLGA